VKTALDSAPQGFIIYPSEQLITDLTFADDVAVLADTRETMQAMIDRIAGGVNSWSCADLFKVKIFCYQPRASISERPYPNWRSNHGTGQCLHLPG